MKLTTIHQVLIIGFMAMAALYAVQCLLRFSRGGERLDGALGVGSTAVAVGAAWYLRRFRRKLAQKGERR
jgi:hypothetical protein